MNEKTSSLFDNEIETSEIDSLLSNKNRGPEIRAAMQYYQTISEAWIRSYYCLYIGPIGVYTNKF